MSKHVHLILDGCYSTRTKQTDTFTQRMFEENNNFCLMEFVWQDFLKKESYLVTPKVNKNFQKLSQCKKYYSNCLGKLDKSTRKKMTTRQTQMLQVTLLFFRV
jgi:hypothetical protein